MAFERFFGRGESTSTGAEEEGVTAHSLLGTSYDITAQNTVSVGDAAITTETAGEGPVAGPHVREMFESAVETAPAPLWIGYDADTHRGFREAPLRFEALFRHLWITGTTGYGKSTALLNMLVQWAYAGYGFVFVDPKARDSRQLLRMLPEHRLDDIVWIEPGATAYDKTVGLNFLELPECATQAERENEIENRIENLKAIFDTDEYWGVNMESITESMARAMMQSETSFSVIDMYFTLLNAERREDFALDVDDPYVQEFCLEIARMDDETIRPLLKRIKTWVENAVIRRIIAHRESTVDFRDIVANDRIVIVSTPVENTDIKKMVTLGVLRNLWSAVQQRSFEQADPEPYFVVCDEFDDIASENLDIESMLARARSMRLSVTLASQYPAQLDEPTRKSMLNNCDTLLTFSVNDVDDARLLMKRFRGYTAEDLISTDQYQAWTKLPLEGGQYSEPVLLNTFPPYPPLRSADAVDEIIEQSLDRYGTDPLTDAEIMQNLVYGDANEAATPDRVLAEQMAEAIRAVQLRQGCRTANDWVDVTAIDEEFSRRQVAFTDDESVVEYDTADLPDVRDESPFIETDIDLESDTVVARLSESGEDIARPETGTVQAAGGTDHDAALRDAERVLTDHGFSVTILEQDGRPLPDGRAVHPAFEATFTIEAETTTPDRPAKVLQNLAQARSAGQVPLFVVRPGDSLTEWANRVERICSPPIRERADGTQQYYNCDEIVTFGGGATTHGGVTAVRPRTSDSNRTVWTREGEDIVLSDGDTEFACIADEQALSKDSLPAYYSFDRETAQYTVYTPGETQVYDSQAAFEDDWVPIKRPFLPAEALPSGDPTRESYHILILPEEGDPQLYQEGVIVPLEDCLASGTLWPTENEEVTENTQRDAAASRDEVTDSTTNAATGEATESADFDGDGIEGFAALYVTEDSEGRVSQETLFEAYVAWLDQQDIDGTTDKGWFTRKLREVVEFDIDRSRVDGERVQFYVGLALTEDGTALLTGDDT